MEFPTAGGSRFADVAGDPLAVVRDALLSQLQHDRLRQEIIVAELAKIERAMALRDASPSPSPSPGTPLERLRQVRHGAAPCARCKQAANATYGIIMEGRSTSRKWQDWS
ncbi:uncharacterized protein [Oryza sativa Japonica Group]|uniref:uncharacterized protein n=1 Tax=Oryza sativa subsp. japonica TaxID=39947 RepID=UPI0007755BD4|nr:uncharacterized protein LOC9269623 isoform X2 [Oryza sativa Japonica Group]